MSILNCPHCGLPADLKYGDLNGTGISLHGWQVMCSSCGTSGPVSSTKTVDEAVISWNKIARAAGQTKGTP